MSEAIEITAEKTEIVPAPQGMAIDRAPDIVLQEAAKAAFALKDVLDKKKDKFMLNGNQYLEFEDWMTLGHFYGVTCGSEGEPEYITMGDACGFKATSIALRHGQIISRATAFCLADEPNWSRKPLFQLSSMAQTRANAKVLRNVLAWVVVLAGYKPTPSEELDGQRVAPKTSSPKQEFPTQVGEIVGTVDKLTARKSRKGEEYLVFTLNDKSIFVWDKKLFPFIREHENKPIAVIAETKGQYTNLISARPVKEAAPAETEPDWESVPPTEEPF